MAAVTAELEDLKAIAQLREEKIEELSNEIVKQRGEITELRLKVRDCNSSWSESRLNHCFS